MNEIKENEEGLDWTALNYSKIAGNSLSQSNWSPLICEHK